MSNWTEFIDNQVLIHYKCPVIYQPTVSLHQLSATAPHALVGHLGLATHSHL